MILFLIIWNLGLHNCTRMGANLNLLNTEMVFVKKGGILYDILWDGLGRVCPCFWEWGYWISAGHCGCISCLSLFCIHRKQAGVPSVTLASHIKELWLKIWDRWGSIRISDIYFAPE